MLASAVPVLADEPPVRPPGEVPLASQSLQAEAGQLPDATNVEKGIAELASEEAAREQELESPQAIQEREESQDAFSAVTATEAQNLLQTYFSDYLDKLNSDPARSITNAESVLITGESSAVVTENGNSALLEAGMPLKAENEDGEKSELDLSLESTGDGFETANAISDVGIGESAADPVQVGDEGLSIEQVGANAGSSSQRFGAQNVFNFEALADTDTVVSPTSAGVEITDMLRSEESPDTLRFRVNLPSGAELRADGRGGAEVVRGEEKLAEIPFPTAVDAQGTEVPVDLEVEGSTIVLHVAHADDFAMPIVVDPEMVLEDWVNSNTSWQNGHNLNALENGAWKWTSEPYGLIYFGTGNPCFYTCWGRGLYLTAPSRNYGANTYSAWAYSAPNMGSYVAKVWLIPFWRDDHGCNRGTYPQPHDYDGFWGDGQWNLLQTNEAAAVGSVAVESWGRAFIVGLSSGGGGNIPCWRDVYVGGAAVWLDDWNQPVLTTSSSGQWMDSTPVRLNVSATDGGLGVRKFTAEATNKSGSTQTWDTWNGCSGTYTSRCPESWSLAASPQPQLAYDPSVLPEGIRTLSVTAYDAVLRKSTTTNGMTVRIDHAPPTLKLSGTVTEQAKLGTERPAYTVRVDAEDGEWKDDANPATNDPTKDRSGVVKISEWVDGKMIHEYAPGCSTQNCTWFDEGAMEAAAYSAGQHTLVVKAEDALHHVAESSLTFKLGDQQAPSVNVSGLPAESSAMPRQAGYWSTFGANGTGNGQLKAPADVAIDANGDIWVADKGNNRIEKFSADGQYLSKFGSLGSGNGQLSSPAALAIDAKGNIWVADKGNGRVEKFNPQGEYLSQFGSKGTGNGQFTSGGPEGIAIDAKGNIWVSDTYGGRVQKFDESGNFLKVVGSKGSAPGQLGEPTGIDIGPGGKVWVADWQNNRVAVFNEAGEFVTQFGSAGTGNGQFNRPDAIAVGSRGDVWVGDQNNGRVEEFDQNGAYLGQFGSKGTGTGQFSFTYPFGVATDSKGSIWIADPNNSRIQRWLAPNTAVNGYLEPVSATANDAGFGVVSVAVKLTGQSGSTETLGQASQSCVNGGCSLSFNLKELDLSDKPSGPYLLNVVATDGAGNRRISPRVLSLDSTPPEVDLSGALAESAGHPLGAPSAQLDIDASDTDPVNGGIRTLNVERDDQLVASYPSNCSNSCREVEASYSFHPATDGADRSIKPVATTGNGSIGELRRVSCVAASDCWAVGRTKYTFAEQVEGKVPEPLLEHWNGSEWQTTTVPKPEGATSLTLEGISCASTNACLAVGFYSNGTNQPLAEYWNGSKWTAGKGPLPSGANKATLYSVSCGASGDCWTYGVTQVTVAEQNEGKMAASFLSRWNGTQWQATTTVPKPEGATSLSLEAISCVSTSACVAVGSYSNGTTQPLAEYWNGSKWTAGSASLPAGATKGYLYGVSCGSAGDCWAYGTTQVTFVEQLEGKVGIPFFDHWHAGAWQAVSMPTVPEGSSINVNGISCSAESACTAAGSYSNPHAEIRPLVYTWDSAGWRFQPMPTPTEATTSSLLGVSCTGLTQCGLVGYWRIGTGRWQVLAVAEAPADTSHQITVEAVDLQGNTASETIEVNVDPGSAALPECSTEPELEPAQGVLTPAQAVGSVEEALPVAVAPTDGATAPSTEETIDPSYSPPSPNLETVDSLATGETSVTPEGGFTLGESVCFTPSTLTPAASDATVVNDDAALFANTAPETDTVIRPTAMGTTLIQSLRGPNAPDSFAWNVKVSPGQDLVELPSGAVAVVEIDSEVEDVAQVPAEPEKAPADLADVEVQVENGEYQLINAADETQLEVVAVIAQPWVVLAQGGIVPALIEVVPDTETPNEFEVWVKLPETPEEEEVWPAQLIVDTASSSSVNGNCTATESPCGALDLDKMAQYAVYWGNEAHHFARNPFYADFKANNCTNFISQILRAGGAKFMGAFDYNDWSWWYRNLSSGGIFGSGPSAGEENTPTWALADTLPRHLWRFELSHIDPVQQPWGWTKGNILAYDWIDSDGKGNVNHLNFVVGTADLPGGREPLIANSSSQGSNYSHMRWKEVKERIEGEHGSQWTRFALAAKHRVANSKAKKHDPANLYGPNGLFGG